MADIGQMKLPPPLDKPSAEERLYLQAAAEWVEHNTRFRFEEGQAPPAGVLLFLAKYAEVMGSGLAAGVQSESLEGMSQSFATGGAGEVLRALAGQLLGEWYSPGCFVPARGRWQ